MRVVARGASPRAPSSVAHVSLSRGRRRHRERGGDGAGVRPRPARRDPAGSGNGLARHFDLPADPPAAIRRLLSAPTVAIDVGELNGRLFVNLAGLGFDAHVAARFASLHRSRRGFLRYAVIVFQELRRYQGAGYEMSCDGDQASTHRAFLISFANGRQWGNGAIIAGCRHRRRLPRRRRRERTDEGDGAPGAAAPVLGDCRSCTRCADSTRGTRASHASGHFRAMSMVSQLHVAKWPTFASDRKPASACETVRYAIRSPRRWRKN